MMRKRVQKTVKVVSQTPAATVSQVTTSTTAIATSVTEEVTHIQAIKSRSKKLPKRTLKLSKLIQAAKQENKAVFNKVPEKMAVKLVSHVFNKLKTDIQDEQATNIKLTGFGRFVIKTFEKDKDGQKISIRSVVFRLIETKKKLKAEEIVVSSSSEATTELTTPPTTAVGMKKANASATAAAKVATKPVENLNDAIESDNVVNENTEKVNKMKQEQKVLKLADLVKAVKAENEGAFDKLNDKKAVAIVRAVFAQVKKQISETEQGNVVLPGLGKFNVKKVQIEKEGKQIAKRRIAFRVITAKKKAAE